MASDYDKGWQNTRSIPTSYLHVMVGGHLQLPIRDFGATFPITGNAVCAAPLKYFTSSVRPGNPYTTPHAVSPRPSLVPSRMTNPFSSYTILMSFSRRIPCSTLSAWRFPTFKFQHCFKRHPQWQSLLPCSYTSANSRNSTLLTSLYNRVSSFTRKPTQEAAIASEGT